MPHIKRVAITGHTKGIGQQLWNRLEDRGIELKGFSKSTGYNLQRVSTCKKVVQEVVEWNADVSDNLILVSFKSKVLILNIFLP